MQIGDIGKVGTNLTYRVGTIEYINEDSLVVKYKDDTREKIRIEDFIPFAEYKEKIAIITSKEFDGAFRNAIKHSNFAESLKAQLFDNYKNKIELDTNQSN